MPPPDPCSAFSGARTPNRLDRLADAQLVSAALAVLRLPMPDLAAQLGCDRRTLQRLAAGGREVRPEQWCLLAGLLEAAALYDRHARALAEACRRRADPAPRLSGEDGCAQKP